jgi:hypothetical protein
MDGKYGIGRFLRLFTAVKYMDDATTVPMRETIA